jgi:hypothetical protein
MAGSLQTCTVCDKWLHITFYTTVRTPVSLLGLSEKDLPRLPTTCITMLRRGHFHKPLLTTGSWTAEAGVRLKCNSSANLAGLLDVNETLILPSSVYSLARACDGFNPERSGLTCDGGGTAENISSRMQFVGWWGFEEMRFFFIAASVSVERS